MPHLTQLRPLRALFTLFALPTVLATSACDDGYRDVLLENDAGTVESGPPPVSQALCVPAKASEPLPAREATMQGGGGGAERETIYVRDLYQRFETNCSSCHGSQSSWYVNRDTFKDKITSVVLERMRSEDPDFIMPEPQPPGLAPTYSQRVADMHPVVEFAALLEQWLNKGKPDSFEPTSSDAAGDEKSEQADSPFRMSAQVGMQLTNLGNCVPSKDAVSKVDEEDEAKAKALDEKFEAMSTFADLPLKLKDTDIVSLDSEQLVKTGVIAFAPAYTLWADYAKKIRHVRVPRGTSIEFDAEQQRFRIPPNTRVYKTFLKRVVDLYGNARYRKMETRIIVARPDNQRVEGQPYQPQALFGSYKWNESETEATLLGRSDSTPNKLKRDELYRDAKDFKDHLETYVVDERIEDQVLASGSQDPDELLAKGARRSYAIPGADRCIHCHMGAPDQSFILGFTPLQIRRRPLGEGGVIEPADQHELDQLQRFIDYGLVTGMKSPEEVVTLESSQGDRKPRNEHELNAQGYMLGNCAHCHNPNGFPSEREKVLKEDLDFQPSATGGIFQFPLDRMSRRSFRGEDQTIQIPYITPSLYDHPGALGANRSAVGAKWIALPDPSPAHKALGATLTQLFPSLKMLYGKTAQDPIGRPLLAPWRSLIYRNVDGPFSYEDGATIFPHMPMDTPGYDCRSRRLLGKWMVSIPARRKPPLHDISSGSNSARKFSEWYADYEEIADLQDQPYIEHTPDQARYVTASNAAQARVERFEKSERYNDCPEPELDVLAPEVVSGQSVVPDPQVTTIPYDMDGGVESYSLLSAPRPHYPDTDLRESESWAVRRTSWYEILVRDKKDQEELDKGGASSGASQINISAISAMPLSPELKSYALSEVPMGLWQAKPECSAKLATQPKVSDPTFSGSNRPRWMDQVSPEPDAAVYTTSPGAQVFTQICSKCHGADGTGQSALASTIADLTGGKTRVANLRYGLFGPRESPGANIAREFSRAGGQDGSVEEWVARYMAWMGLGGTRAAIPQTAVTQVGSASILGVARKANFAAVTDAKEAANMLTVAKKACEVFIGFGGPSGNGLFDPLTGQPVFSGPSTVYGSSLEDRGLVTKNGEAELWSRLCFMQNPLPYVQVVTMSGTGDGPVRLSTTNGIAADGKTYKRLVRREAYPTTAEVGDTTGGAPKPLTPDNLAPWCIGVSSDPVEVSWFEQVQQQVGHRLPRCPSDLPRIVDGMPFPEVMATSDDRSRWSSRGAANAGFAVYLYLNALSKGELKPKPAYDACEKL